MRRAVPASCLAALVLSLLVAQGCAANPGAATRSHDPYRITVEEMAGTSASNAYEAVQMLRPAWLRSRTLLRGHGPDQRAEIVVILNGSRYGTAESLRNISVGMIGYMEYLEGGRAQQEFTHQSGRNVGAAILVSTSQVAPAESAPVVLGRSSLPRLGVTVVPVSASLLTPASGHEASFASGGWTRTAGAPAARPMSGQAIAEVRAEGPLYLSLALGSKWGRHSESYTKGLWEYHMEHGSMLMAGLVGYRLGPIRVAAGPAMELTAWETSLGACACLEPRKAASRQTGVAASAALAVPITAWLAGELRLEGRHLPVGSADPYPHAPPFEFGWSQVGIGVGIGVGRRGW
jgi:hypothetical protein